MAIPYSTIVKVGVNRLAGALRFKAHDDYKVDGIDLNDLCGLAVRLETAMTDANELRDWQNRLNEILSRAVNLTESY